MTPKTAQGNTVVSGADCSVSYSTTTDCNAARLSGLPAEIEVEAGQLQKEEGKSGQLPRNHG